MVLVCAALAVAALATSCASASDSGQGGPEAMANPKRPRDVNQRAKLIVEIATVRVTAVIA